MDTHVLFWGHWYPCFGFLGVMSPLGFKAKVGSALFTFCRGKCNVHSLRSTSDATHVDLLAASITASPVPTYCCRSEVVGIRTRCSQNICESDTLPTELNWDRLSTFYTDARSEILRRAQKPIKLSNLQQQKFCFCFRERIVQLIITRGNVAQ